MSETHLGKGSVKPPKEKGKLRLYSMKYCPFVKRVRLVLLAKNIPHDIVNIDIFDKPEWFLELNRQGLVPVLDTGSEILTESMDICEYLDMKYPDPPLSSQNGKDKDLAREFNQVWDVCRTAYFNKAKPPFEEFMRNLLPHLEKYEKELKIRGTYFGGDKPNMLDYMLWPFGESAGIYGLIYDNEKLPDEKQFPSLYSWCKAMRTQKGAREVATKIEKQYIIQQQRLNKEVVNIDI